MFSRPWSWFWKIRPNHRSRLRRRGARPCVEPLEERTVPSSSMVLPVLTETEPNDSQVLANPIPLGAIVNGTISSPTDVDYYAINVTKPGALTASVERPAGSTLDTRLALEGITSYLIIDGQRVGGGGVLAASDDRAPGNPDPLLQQFLRPGPFYLVVSAAPGANATGLATSGAYTLHVDFQAVSDSTRDPANLEQPGAVVGNDPVAIVAADMNRDGVPDLVTVNRGPGPNQGSVSILLDNGEGSFRPVYPLDHLPTIPATPASLAVTDFNGDGLPDVAILDATRTKVFILPGLGDGRVLASQMIELSANDPAVLADPVLSALVHDPAPIVAHGDFNRDGTVDTAKLVELPGSPGAFAPAALVLFKFPPNRPSFIDYPPVTVPLFGGPLDVTSQVGDVGFALTDARIIAPPQAIPQLADLDGDGTLDAVLVTRTGDILFRAGRADSSGNFDPPLLVNSGDTPRARAIALVRQGPGKPIRIAALDLGGDTVSLYDRQADGTWKRTGGFGTILFASRIVAGDLDGDGRDDLVVTNSELGTPTVYLAQADGSFKEAVRLNQRGDAASGILLADVNGDGRTDILVTDPASGNVGVFLNLGRPRGSVGFAPFQPVHAAPALNAQGNNQFGVSNSTVDDITNNNFDKVLGSQGLTPAIFAAIFHAPLFGGELFPPLYFGDSPVSPSSLASADFTGDGIPDVVVANTGADSFTLLQGKGGGFIDPGPQNVFATGSRPSLIVAAQLTDDGFTDVVTLDSGSHTVSVFLNDGKGNFHLSWRGPAGDATTGLTVADVNGDGKPDLVLGSEFGDLLVLLGDGKGHFQVPRGHSVPFVTADLTGNGMADVVLSNQAHDQVSIELRQPGTTSFVPSGFLRTASDGLAGPVSPLMADLTGEGRPDLMFANSAGNSVTVFLSQADGTWNTRTFATGTNPAGMTVADLNGDGIPDLIVANRGSNDISIFFGQGHGDNWTFLPAQRLQVGRGPIAVEVRDVTGVNGTGGPDGLPDLLVTNGEDGTVTVLPGLSPARGGAGFFADPATPPLRIPNPDGPGAPRIVAQHDGFMVTDRGSVINADTMASVFRSEPGREVTNVASFVEPGASVPELFVARADGSVSRLTSQDGGMYTEAQVFRDANLVAPSALEVVDQGGRLELYVTDAVSGQPLVFTLDVGTGLLLPQAVVEAAGPASAEQTSVGGFNLGFVATLLMRGGLDAPAASRGATAADVPVQEIVLGVDVGLRNQSVRAGGDVGEQLPVEVWWPVLRGMVSEWAPAAGGDLLVHGKALTETAVAVVQTVAVPAWQALQALGLPDLPLATVADASGSLRSLAVDIGQGLLDAAQAVSAELVKRALSHREADVGPLPGAVETAVPESRGRSEGTSAKGREDEESLEVETAPAAEGLCPTGLFDSADRGSALGALLTGAVFAAGLYASPSFRSRRRERRAVRSC